MKNTVKTSMLLSSAAFLIACSATDTPNSAARSAPSKAAPAPARAEVQAYEFAVADVAAGQLQKRAAIGIPQMPVYPAPEQRENYEHSENNTFIDPMQQPLSTLSTDVDTASFANARRFINAGNRVPVDAVRAEEFINYFDYDYKQPSGKLPLAMGHELAATPWSAQTSLLSVSLQAKDVLTQGGKNLVFLIDVSGSMGSDDKLGLLKRSLALLVNQLSDKDKVSIITYAGQAQQLLDGVSASQKQRIIAAINGLRAGGSTNGEDGLALAYEAAQRHFIDGGANKIFLATDGDFNLGMQDPRQMESYIADKRETGVSLNVIGLGTGNYNDQMMERISNVGNGAAVYIDSLMQAQKALIDQLDALLSTLAWDVKFQVEFNPKTVARYRLIGYQNRQLQDHEFKDDKVDAADIGAGQSVTALYELVLKDGAQGLRYAQGGGAALDASDELAYVKLRYKTTRTASSKEYATVVRYGDRAASVAQSSNNFRLASAAAIYAQKLRGQAPVQGFSWKALIAQAQGAKGADDKGYRSAFIQQLRLSESVYQSR